MTDIISFSYFIRKSYPYKSDHTSANLQVSKVESQLSLNGKLVHYVGCQLEVLIPHTKWCFSSVCVFGDLMKINTTGASSKTASQDNYKIIGVEASRKMAEYDLKRMDMYKPIIMNVARDKQLDPAVIAGIISRETRAGSPTSGLINGWGDGGNAFGLMQVDKRYHDPKGDWDSEEHIHQATDILIYFIKIIKEKFPNWSKGDHFKGGIAAYNAGQDSVCSHADMDCKTTGGDYANDVVARAQFFKLSGY